MERGPKYGTTAKGEEIYGTPEPKTPEQRERLEREVLEQDMKTLEKTKGVGNSRPPTEKERKESKAWQMRNGGV